MGRLIAIWAVLIFTAWSESAYAQSKFNALQNVDPWPYRIYPLSCRGKCSDATGLIVGCDGKACYGRSGYGAFNIAPKRTYHIIYSDNADVCTTIERALNWSMAQDVDVLAKLEQGRPPGAAFDNALFLSDVFVRWNQLNGPIWVGDPNTPKDKRIINPTLLERWMIAPLLNNGRPYLITKAMYEDDLTVWDYSPEELSNYDWSNPDNYNARRQMGDSESFFHKNIRYGKLEGEFGVNYFPKLPDSVRNSAVWRNTNRRLANQTEIALIHGQFYGVFVSARTDVVFVVDFTRPPGDDVCYMESDFSHHLVSQ